MSIAVTSDGKPIVVNTDGDIYQMTGTISTLRWTQIQGKARQVSVGGLDEIGIITRDSDISETNAGGAI